MPSIMINNRCLWSCLLTLTIVACVCLLYFSVVYSGAGQGNKESLKTQYIQSGKLTEETCISVCDTKECILEANMLLTTINEQIGPCDNFRQFLCGAYEEKFGHGDRESIVNEATQKMYKKLQDILDNIKADANSASGKMKTLYDSCMDYSSEFQGVIAAQQIFNNFGILNWPKNGNFSPVEHDLSTVLGNLKAYGEFEFLVFGPVLGHPEEHQTNKKVIMVEFLFSFFEEVTEFPKEAGVQILKYFDLESNEINQILQDHETIKNSIKSLKQESTMGCIENCTDVYVNCKNETDAEWLFLCETVKTLIGALDLKDVIRDDSIFINIYWSQFLKQFISLLNRLTRRSVANFLAMNFFWRYLGKLNFYFRLVKQKYFETKPSEPVLIDKWKYCVQFISKTMTLALEHEYFEQHLTRPSVQDIYDVYRDFNSDIGDIVAQQEWIPLKEKFVLENQIRNMSSYLFLLNEILPNETFVSDYFKMFHPVPGNFFHNVLQLRRATFLRLYYAAMNISEQDHFLEIMLEEIQFKVQASTGGETVDMQFGMFFPPFYEYGLIRQMNLASLAPVLGHELGHVLLCFLENLLKEDHEETSKVFHEKKECIESQFSNFKFDLSGENLNGTQYYSENLADNVGTMLLEKIIEKHDSASEATFLPGLPYTTKQILYMKANLFECGKSDIKEEIIRKTDVHAPEGYRLIGTMQNSRGFSEAFQCSNGSYMNPTVKCSLLN